MRYRVMRGVIVMIAALLPGWAAAADLYEASTIVTGTVAETRSDGLARCLREVLVKVSGDPALADEKRIPDLSWCSDPAWVFEGSTYHLKCNYQLLVDNLMDLSHETFVHPSSIGQHEILEAPIKVTADATSVRVTRWMHNIDPPPFWAANLRSFEKCDR